MGEGSLSKDDFFQSNKPNLVNVMTMGGGSKILKKSLTSFMNCPLAMIEKSENLNVNV